MFYIGVYVDDIILVAGKTERDLTDVKTTLSRKFDIKDLGKLNYFLGVKIEQWEDNSVWIGQPAYTKNLLENIWNERLQISQHTSKHWLQAYRRYWWGRVCGSAEVQICYWKLNVSFCEYMTRYRICCEQSCKVYLKILPYQRSTGKHCNVCYGTWQEPWTMEFSIYTKDGSSTCIDYTDADCGLEMWTIVNQHQGTYFCFVEEQYLGRARNRDELLCQLLKQSI